MDYGHDNKSDRLSNLPDDLIHKILSFIDIEDAVKTMILSSRYRSIWTTTPYFNNFSTDEKFVENFLKRRNNQIDVSSLKLDNWKIEFTHPSVQKLMQYAISHNIQQFEFTCWPKEDFGLTEFPVSLLSSQSLTHLSLTLGGFRWWASSNLEILKLKATSIMELPALTTLYLGGVIFYSDDDNCVVNDLLSKCTNLKNLTLKRCKTDRSLSICHPGLSSLTLDSIEGRFDDLVNVVAPQLKNLTIRCDEFNTIFLHVISAPNLASLAYRGRYPLQLSTDGFHSLKEADIRVLADHPDPVFDYPYVADAHQMVGLLQQLHNVKFLTLNLEIIELISKSVELISHQPSPFVNLESLTIYPEILHDLEENLDDSETRSRPKGKVNLSTEVRNYFLDSSPGASVTMFSREEIIAERDFASAQKKMAELRVLLKQEKANIKTYDRANTNGSGKAPIDEKDINAKMQLHIRRNKLIKSCWKDLEMQINQRETTVYRIIYKLESIEEILGREMPPTKSAMIQACFSSLCAEADIVMSKMLKMQRDEHQSRISACFQELATSTTTMEPSYPS